MSVLGKDLILDSTKKVRGNMVGMTNPNESDLVKLGYDVVISGELAQLRDLVLFTRNAQAVLMGVDGENLRKWEQLDRGMNIDTALRIGEWYWAAQKVLETTRDFDFSTFIHASKAAQYLGVPAQEVGHYAAAENIAHEDLGVLGVFIPRTELGRN